MCDNPEGSKDLKIKTLFDGSILVQRQVVKEEDISKFDYKWRWNLHLVAVVYVTDGKEKWYRKSIWFQVREYQALVSGDRQFVEYWLADLDLDGKVDQYFKKFEITTPSCNTEYFRFVFPQYPKGFVNFDWYKMSKKELDEVFNKELNFWHNVMMNKSI